MNIKEIQDKSQKFELVKAPGSKINLPSDVLVGIPMSSEEKDAHMVSLVKKYGSQILDHVHVMPVHNYPKGFFPPILD